MIQQLSAVSQWDICIIGGGATGIAAALDASSRGLKTILLEQSDFAKGTSSRSTKLVHGGVRYLRQGNIKLVREALYERGLLLRNAPHLVQNRSFIIPVYKWWEKSYYGIGLKIYDQLAGSLSLGASRILSGKSTMEMAPTLQSGGLRGAVVYHDGQFDDARLALSMANTASIHGGIVLNYFQVDGFLKSGGKISGVTATDKISGKTYEIKSRIVINATGVFSDTILKMDEPGHQQMITPSQGIHIVVDKKFLPGDAAIMIPRTSDGRVLFAVPWHDKTVIGTTDTAIKVIDEEPVPLQSEIDFILQDARRYFEQAPTYADIRSVFAGLRPLIRGRQKNTAALSRDYSISTSSSGLVSINGGKWTTCRKMAERVINVAMKQGSIQGGPCVTRDLSLSYENQNAIPSSVYDASISDLKTWITHAIKNEMCETVEDFLSRRTRQLILDAAAAIEMAPRVADIMGDILGQNDTWKQSQIHIFKEIAGKYLPKQN